MKVANVREMVSLQQQMGWKVLRNEHLSLERDGQHIIVAGMENDGNGKKFPQRGDITKTSEGVAEGACAEEQGADGDAPPEAIRV